MNAVTPTEADTAPNVFTALSAAQGEFSAPKKDSTNPAFRTKYADLRSVVDAVAPALSRHGLAFVHYADARDLGTGPEPCMVTALIHGASGTRIECPVPLILGKRDMQGFKSATTYAKRIGLESVTGVAPDDDDGNDAASAAPKNRAEPPREPRPDPVQTLIDAINAAPTLDALVALWREHAKTHAAADPRAIKAKDDRKAALTPPPADPAPTAPTIGEQIGDEIPY